MSVNNLAEWLDHQNKVYWWTHHAPEYYMSLEIVKAKVIPLNNVTTLDIPAERVLNAALEANLSGVVIMGTSPDGSYYFASSVADGGTVLWMWEKLKAQLLGD